MAPAVVEATPQDIPVNSLKAENGAAAGGLKRKPVEATGVLDNFKHYELTPILGRVYPEVDLVELLDAPNSDELIRELALTISQRNVVVFRKQDRLTNDRQKELIQRIGELSGKPSTSRLHIHPLLNSEDNVGADRADDLEISTISTQMFKKVYSMKMNDGLCLKKQNADQWHSDIGFEPVPSDYSSLRLTQLPKCGGDTLYASGYEIYDRLSPPMQQMLEGLTATFARPDMIEHAKRGGFRVYEKARGAPENVGLGMKAVHPVIRTNPVTGWKSLFSSGQHVSHINGVTYVESAMLIDWFKHLINNNHDLRARVHWENVNDIAIWDNRSTFHQPTYDFEGLGGRAGNRVVSCGEVPYYDPASTGRQEAIGEDFCKYFSVR